jgi:hypothetical protein
VARCWEVVQTLRPEDGEEQARAWALWWEGAAADGGVELARKALTVHDAYRRVYGDASLDTAPLIVEQDRSRAAAVPMFPFDRELVEDEQSLVTHISRWGSDGYPIKKAGRRHWTWSYRSLEAPVLYPTKTKATAAFEAYLDVLYSCLGAAAYRRAVADLRDAAEAMR